MAEKGKPGRPPNLSDPVPLKVSLPKQQHDYLTLLAKRGILGVTQPDIAAHILVRELDEMFDAGVHERKILDS